MITDTASGNTDPVTAAAIAWLRARGADDARHRGGRSLLAHLVGTYEVVRAWSQPAWLQHGALIHSVYGTDAYHRQLVPVAARAEVAAVAGEQAERLAYLFGTTPRGPLLAGTHRWARGLAGHAGRHGPGGSSEPPSAAEFDALVLLHMANLAEQAQASDGSPGRWVARLGELSELLADAEELHVPRCLEVAAGCSEAEEAEARRAYGEGVALADDPPGRAIRFGLAAAALPIVAEPCAWLAYLAHLQGDLTSARSWAAHARERLHELGTPWDKRLTLQEWTAVIDALGQAPEVGAPRATGTVAHPRALLAALTRRPRGGRSAQRQEAPDAATGRRRFQRYVEALASSGSERSAVLYPDLPSRPWHDPAEFPLVEYLESNCEAIRDEILALETDHFHRESERIRRSGDWDVAFLYERGRRHNDVCAACPVTTRGIEAHAAMRASAGLMYVSRMRGSTHIEPHRGPTNLRLRCHLGITVPEGDCAIRVGEQTRRWQEGECLVFDDHFEHEAWNHTDEDRIVLIVDLWHPGLSATEVALLTGLHDYAYGYARRLNGYWSTNAAAAHRESGGVGDAT